MDSSQSHGHVSVIGTNFLYPICRLLEALQALNSQPNEVQASPLDNGYSASIIVLSVLMLESAINRTQYIRGEKPPKKPLDFLRSAFPDSGFTDKVEELLVARDAIAHNHLWETQFDWDEQAGMRLISTQLEKGYGDKKFERAIDFEKRKTKQMGINLPPTRICRQDALTVLKTVFGFLMFLENQNENYIYISGQTVQFGKRILLFSELITNL